MKTNLCHMLGIEHPIIAAPMSPDLTGPDLVAAVSNAGGLGILQAQLCPPPLFRQEIRRVRALTDRPFGVNLVLHFPIEDQRRQKFALAANRKRQPEQPIDNLLLITMCHG